METTILKINDPARDIEKLKKAANCIDSGGLVVFPTETVYGIACKVDPVRDKASLTPDGHQRWPVSNGADLKSLARLDEVKKRDTDKRYTLHIGWREPSPSGDKNKLQEFVPTLTLPAKKLVADAWPGPLTIVFEVDKKDIARLEKNLGTETVELLYRDNTIGIRCPENDIAREFLNLCKYPVVAPSANTSGKDPATNAEQAIEQLDGLVDMILDGGACKYKKSSTVVKISQAGWEVLREGVFSKRQIQKMLTVNILFVCTGNTCRSPMAEGFARKALAEKLGCKVDQLGQMGYKVASAGSVAVNGIDASDESIRFCNSKGVDIARHKSRRITTEMLKDADYIFAMSAGHKNDIIQLCPDAERKCMLLSDSGDIKDPIGGDFEAYKICGGTIEKAVNKRISELLK